MLASCAFKNQVTGEVDIPSRWKKETTVQDAETQTSQLKSTEQEVQTDVSCLQVSTQLDKGTGTEHKIYQASLDGLQYMYAGVPYNEAKLAAFLEGSKDELLDILHRNAKSSIFDHYTPNWSRRNTELSLLYTLSSPASREENLQALSVAWNTSGTIVAVAYGRIDTSGWCYSKGYVAVWNLARPDLDERMPHYTLETDSYATAISFHPTDAAMLAVGTYGGEVVLYPNVTDSAVAAHSSAEAELSHTEPVTVLQWVLNPQELRKEHRILLCSAGQNGLILHWSVHSQLTHPVAAYRVHSRRRLPAGISALAYTGVASGRDANLASLDGILHVGLENGEVGRGRTGLPPVSAGDAAPPTVTPVELDWLEGHRGPVQEICASPFFRHLLLTCSSDGSARLYTDLERSPLLTLEPSAETKGYLYGAAFSPFRPTVMAVVSRDAQLHLYDLQKDQSRPAYTVEAAADGMAVQCLAFNPTAADWLATGDAQGSVKVWRLPTDISQATELERAALRSTQPSRDKAQAAADSSALHDLFGFMP